MSRRANYGDILREDFPTREEFVLTQAKELKKLVIKRRFLHAKMDEEISDDRWKKLNNDLSWLCMEISKTEERIGYALGHLTLRELRNTYSPSGWQTYKGVAEEMEKIIFREL